MPRPPLSGDTRSIQSVVIVTQIESLEPQKTAADQARQTEQRNGKHGLGHDQRPLGPPALGNVKPTEFAIRSMT